MMFFAIVMHLYKDKTAKAAKADKIYKFQEQIALKHISGVFQ